MSEKVPMQFPYGAVYFRKSNPPQVDWERDYQVVDEDGFNIFRHWFMWGAIETAPGEYDWSDYDRQMDLAAQHGIKVIIAEFIDAVPEWLYAERKDLMFRRADGSVPENSMGASCPAGGFYAGLCLDNPESRKLAGGFLKALAEHYKDHPALLGYDIWNETNFRPDVCYCEHTCEAFRAWLKNKYGSLKELGKSWCRYSYTDWSQVYPPRTMEFYMESMDWLLFRKENVYKQMKWRIEQIRSVDQKCLIAAHGTAASIDRQALSCYDEWAAAENVELYGLTYVPCRHTGAPWRFWGAVDLTRAGAREKTIWHAEMQGGPLWLQPQVLGRSKEDGRIPTAEDVRLYNLSTIACGSRGILYPRMRPILNGPLFGAFGPYAMDGSRTARSDMASTIAKWTNQPKQRSMLKAVPVQSKVGILMLTEAQIASYLLSVHGGKHAYGASVWGAYRAFFDNNIQADFVNLKDIDRYKLLYLPYALLLTEEQKEKLEKWVQNGGTLIAEAATGYFNERAYAAPIHTGDLLEKLFGTLEDEVEFTPDILEELQFVCLGMPVRGGMTLQSYKPTSGKACGKYADGRTAAVINAYGKGQTLLIGSNLSESYSRIQSEENRRFFASLLGLAGIEQMITIDDSSVKARVHKNENGEIFIWVINTVKNEKTINLKHSSEIKGIPSQFYRGNEKSITVVNENTMRITVPGKDAVVFALK